MGIFKRFLGNQASGAQFDRPVPRGRIAVIMDGNGRWAKKRGMPRSAGHAVGAETFRTIATYCKDIGVQYFTVYAFSTENWKRPQEEVDALMNLFRKYLKEAAETMAERGVAVRVLGDLTPLPADIRAPSTRFPPLRTDLVRMRQRRACASTTAAATRLKTRCARLRRRSRRANSTLRTSPRTAFPRGFIPRTCPTRILLSARRGKSVRQTSCCGSRRTANITLPMCCGPTFRLRTWTRRLQTLMDAAAVLAR